MTCWRLTRALITPRWTRILSWPRNDFEFSSSSSRLDQRAENIVEAENSAARAKELDKERTIEFMASTKAVQERVQGMIRGTGQGVKAAKTLDLSERLLELREKMYDMTH